MVQQFLYVVGVNLMSTNEEALTTNNHMISFLEEVYGDYLDKHNLPNVSVEELQLIVDMGPYELWTLCFTELWDCYH